MTGAGHLIIGGALITPIIMNSNLSPAEVVAGFAVGLTASVLPDIDANNSILQVALDYRKPKILNTLFSKRQRKGLIGGLLYEFLAIIEIFIRFILKSFIEIVKSFTKHRGIVHSLFFLVASSLVLNIVLTLLELNLIYTLLYIVGYGSHLLADACTVSGLRLFAPFSNKPIHLLPKGSRVRMGRKMSVEEMMIVSIVAASSFLITMWI